jgi:hypothetical protein
VARIRSIKPEFFTSETIGGLDRGTRLTFIGVWTYVDDNGVGVDNARLINAAVYPLEDDPTEALRRTLEDLRRLAEVGLIQRYEVHGKRYLFVSTWDEHQQISHPRKTRFPRPEPGVTCTYIDTPETLRRNAGAAPAILRPEQGAGSREQGTATRVAENAIAEPDEQPPAAPDGAQTLLAEWIDHCRASGGNPPSRVKGQLAKELGVLVRDGIPTTDIRAGLQAWDEKSLHPSALASCVHEVRNPPRKTNGVKSTSNERVGAGLRLAAKYEAEEAAAEAAALNGTAALAIEGFTK